MDTCHLRPNSRVRLTTLFTVVTIALTLFAVPAMSQTNTFPTSGNVGIGTLTPQGKLHVSTGSNTNGLIIQNSSLAGIQVGVFYPFTNAGSPTLTDIRFWLAGHDAMTFSASGNVGIGTTAPQGSLHVLAANNANGLIIQNSSVAGFQGGVFYPVTNGSQTDIRFWLAGHDVINFSASGNVGIGTTTPTAALDVTGDIKVSGNIAAKYQDVAEWVPATEAMEPGTVVVLNPEKSNEVMPATRAYDTTVAGVVSTNPGLTLGESAASKAQIATVGRVRVKASATEQPIHIGDLLVTSGKSGLAMKSEPMEIRGRAFHQPGTILGKALEPLASGEGEILVLLSLQ